MTMEWWQVIYAVFVTDIRNQQHGAGARPKIMLLKYCI